jgi:two-component system, cell cycle response regulator DivK
VQAIPDDDRDLARLAAGCVLLIETEVHSARLVRLALKQAHCNTQWVQTSSQAALLLLAGLRPTAIVLDVDLLGDSGLDFVRFVKSTRELAGIPTVGMTVIRGKSSLQAAQGSGCDAYLAKPLDLQRFAHSLAPLVVLSS